MKTTFDNEIFVSLIGSIPLYYENPLMNNYQKSIAAFRLIISFTIIYVQINMNDHGLTASY